jgi:hypothetical protein
MNRCIDDQMDREIVAQLGTWTDRSVAKDGVINLEKHKEMDRWRNRQMWKHLQLKRY